MRDFIVRLLRSSEYKVMPWRNKAGGTTQIAIFPECSRIEDNAFSWRVSIAETNEAHPFSLFPDYDRTLLMVEGRRFVIRCGPEVHFDLSPGSTSIGFPGEWQLSGSAPEGPVRNFNLMCRRGQARGRLREHVVRGAIQDVDAIGSVVVLHNLKTSVRIVNRADKRCFQLAPADSLILDTSCGVDLHSFRVCPTTESAGLALAEIDLFS